MAYTDNQIILNMYQGEANRDASSKVRGFFFQELIAVEELIKPQTNYVCSEYLEDVFAVSGNTVYIVQAKYYPRSAVSRPEVMRELYYQYLRMRLYGYSGNVIPALIIHTDKVPQKPTLEIMQGARYVNVSRTVQPLIPADVDAWLKKNVYPITKIDAENVCFQNYAWDGSIKEFLEALEIISDRGTLKMYRMAIANRLDAIGFNGCPIIDGDMRKNVLLGLAIQCIQETYNEVPAGICVHYSRKLDRNFFLKYINDRICIETDMSIGAYLRMVVMDCWDLVEMFNVQLAQEQTDMLQCIRDNTADWLYHLGSTPQGQLQLLNTVSMRDGCKFLNFSLRIITKRRQMIHEHHDAINIFLRYLWKIMLNINCDLLGRVLTTAEQDRLRPETYMDGAEARYLKVIFPGETARSTIILSSPNSSKRNEEIACTFERIEAFRPQKWYMCGQYSGRFSYSQKATDITNNNTVSVLQPDQFRIECMNCVKVDMDCWHQMEDCKNTIFLDNCTKDTEVDQ